MRHVRAHALIVVGSLLVFNALVLIVVGFILAIFMERPAGLIFAIGCWTASGVLFAMVRFIDRIN
jgi:hypothetical protein